MEMPLYKKVHQAAVKGLDWSPQKSNIVATGGGSADKCIRVFDIIKNEQVAKRNTGS